MDVFFFSNYKTFLLLLKIASLFYSPIVMCFGFLSNYIVQIYNVASF